MGDITREDILGFRRALLETPANWTKRFPGMTLPQAIEANRKRPRPFPTLSVVTVGKKWLSHVKSILTWCVDEGILKENPSAGVNVPTSKGQQRDAREPFTPDQLKRMFAGPAFQGDRDSRFWALLLAAYTGCRAQELGQLLLSDVIDRDGVPVLAITDAGAKDNAKRVKTDSSRRLVPLHKDLISLGFQEFVEAGREAGHERVLQGWSPDAEGGYANGIPRWFNRTYLKSVGAKTDTTTFHSFRHTFKTRLAEAGVARDVSDALTGHADSSVGGRYVHGRSIKQLAEGVNQITYPEIDVAKLSPLPHPNSSRP